MRANTVTTIVNALSERGMLDRVAADDDRRAVELTVTEAGQQAVLVLAGHQRRGAAPGAVDAARQAAPRPGRRGPRARRPGPRDRPAGRHPGRRGGPTTAGAPS